MKTAVKVVGIAILAIAVLAIVVVLSLDSAIRKGIETVGSHSLGVDVRLKRAHLSIMKGRLTISGLEISNPEGFKTDTLFKVEQAGIAVRPRSLFKDEIAIKGIVLKTPSITVEQSASGTNMSKVLENIEGPGKKEPEPAEGKAEKTYRIGVIRVKDASVTFSSFMTAKAPVTVPLPDIEMKDISSDDGTGLALAQVIQQVFQEMMKTALTEGKGIISSDMMKGITGDLGDLVPGLTGEGLEQSEGVVEKTKGTLRGLFGR